MTRPTAFSFFLLLAAVLILPSQARAASEICVDNANSGATISFYIYKADDKDRVNRNALWQATHQVRAAPSRCVAASKIPGVTYGDRVIVYYTVEGKIGKAHFRCPGHTVSIERNVLYRVNYQVTGRTVFGAPCRRFDHDRGEFMGPNQYGNAQVYASKICFDNHNHGAIVHYNLYDDVQEYLNRKRRAWQVKYEQALEPRRCIDLRDIKGVKNNAVGRRGTSFLATAHTTGIERVARCPGFTLAKFDSNTVVQYNIRGTIAHNMRCEREIRTIQREAPIGNDRSDDAIQDTGVN